MSKTLQSWYRSSPTELVSVEWTGAPGQRMWDMLFRVLQALGSTQTVFESVRGRVNVAWRGEPARGPQTWSIVALPGGLEELRERVRSGGGAWEPTSSVLCGDVDLLLPDDIGSVEIADWEDDDEREHAFALPMKSGSAQMETPPGLRGWKAVPTPEAGEEDAPVYLDVACAARDQPPKLWLDAQSRFELWRPWTIDDDGPVPGGRKNLERLRHALEQVAAATGGTVSLPAAMQAELDRANGVR